MRCYWLFKDIIEIQNCLFVHFFLKDKLPKSYEKCFKDPVVFILTQKNSAALNAYVCFDAMAWNMVWIQYKWLVESGFEWNFEFLYFKCSFGKYSKFSMVGTIFAVYRKACIRLCLGLWEFENLYAFHNFDISSFVIALLWVFYFVRITAEACRKGHVP